MTFAISPLCARLAALREELGRSEHVDSDDAIELLDMLVETEQLRRTLCRKFQPLLKQTSCVLYNQTASSIVRRRILVRLAHSYRTGRKRYPAEQYRFDF